MSTPGARPTPTRKPAKKATSTGPPSTTSSRTNSRTSSMSRSTNGAGGGRNVSRRSNVSTRGKATLKENGLSKNHNTTQAGDENDEQLIRMKTPNFLAKDNEPDCEIRLAKGEKVYAHKAVLRLWSPSFEELFSREGNEDLDAVDLPDLKKEDVVKLLQVIYPPNKPITDHNVLIVLRAASACQMQEVTAQCEERLLARKPSLALLTIADNMNLQSLREKCIEGLKDIVSIKGIDRDRQSKDLSVQSKVELYKIRVTHIEQNELESKADNKDLEVRFYQFYQMFHDVKEAWGHGIDEEQRKATYQRVNTAKEDLLKDEPDNLKAYTDPEGSSDANPDQP